MEALSAALATDGLIWLAAAAVAAGLVRGFTGFGTAMVYMPVAAQILDPAAAIATLLVMDLIGPIPAVPRAVREGHPKDILILIVGACAGLPAGLWVLGIVSPELFRTGVSLVALAMLGILATGARYRGRVSTPVILGTGAAAGVLSGATGLPGPPVILLYMASTLPAAAVRANTLLFLSANDILFLVAFMVTGLVSWEIIVLGLVQTPIYMAAVMTGTLLFRPEKEKVYRIVAYVVIAASAVRGLPFWG